MIKRYNLQINPSLYNFVNDEALVGTNINQEHFWEGFSSIVNQFQPINKLLLDKRHKIQSQLNNWNKKNKGKEISIQEQKEYLQEIGYIVKEGEDFKIETTNVDSEIALVCGPQLVVPITNARYALNAVNARWGSSVSYTHLTLPTILLV